MNHTILDLTITGLDNPAGNISTPYVYLGSDQFDFDMKDANFERMVREAELQNADIVAGAFKDESGFGAHE